MNKSSRYTLLLLASCPVCQTFCMFDWLSGTAGDREKLLAVEARYREAFARGTTADTLALLRRQSITSGEVTLPLVKAQQDLVLAITELKKIQRRQSNSVDETFTETLPELVRRLTALGDFVATQEEFARERTIADERAERERMNASLERFSRQIESMNAGMSHHFAIIDSHLSGLEDRVGSLDYRVSELSNGHTALARTVGDLSDYSHEQIKALSAAVYGGARYGDSHDTRRV